ncbi:MAG: class I SAM-dependent methyltransferase [Cyanobacteria bacterium SBLK]|nr:class I SAM-dependent methyltransferase [Cyanobacteria bacterium SBLK]
MTAVRQDTLWKRFLEPIFGVLLDREAIQQADKQIDWEKECDRLTTPHFIYPEYYQLQNFHGIEGGYLNKVAATTYDPITRYALPPNEDWIREAAIAAIAGQPESILDLGCGTGSMALHLKRAFPEAKVTGLDLSPYMLAIADYKSQQAGLDIHWQHGKAEATPLRDRSFDLIMVALLFHETPPEITRAILRECFRLLSEGGQIIVSDGNQKNLRHVEWVSNIFEEPYLQDYLANTIEADLGAAGFAAVQSQDVWWANQVTRANKPVKSI